MTEEQSRTHGAQFDALALLRHIAGYVHQHRWIHVVFLCVAIVLAVLLVRSKPRYVSAFALVISDTWISPDEMQYVLDGYARGGDTASGLSDFQRHTKEILLKGVNGADYVERQTPQGLKLVFNVQCQFTKKMNRELLKRDVIRYISEHPYVIRVCEEREQEIMLELRSLDSMSQSIRKTFRNLLAEGGSGRFLVDVNSLADPDKLFVSRTDLQIKLSRLKRFCDIVSVGEFENLSVKRTASFTVAFFLLLSLIYGGIRGFRALLNPTDKH